MSEQGWISIHRKIRDCEIWLDAEPFDKRSAWLDILLSCNHAPKNVVLGMKTVTVECGSFVTSQAHLAEKWHWGRQKVRDYLKLLQTLKMVTIKTTSKFSVVKVLNYEVYQGLTEQEKPSNQPTNNQQITNEQPTSNQQITTNNNDNNYNNDNNNIYAVVVNTNNISKGGSNGNYNPIIEVQKALGYLPSPMQAEQFKGLFDEVGPVVFSKALEKAAKRNARNFSYVESTAMGIASGNDFDERQQGAGGIDWDRVREMVKD